MPHNSLLRSGGPGTGPLSWSSCCRASAIVALPLLQEEEAFVGPEARQAWRLDWTIKTLDQAKSLIATGRRDAPDPYARPLA
jgi:hypothetical protein